MKSSITELLDFLHENASKDNPHFLLSPSTFVKLPLQCRWNEPLPTYKIESFLKEKNWEFPEDYKHFLSLHNGGVVFCHHEYGGGVELLSLGKMELISTGYENIPRHCYPIAWTDHNAGAICIDSDKLSRGDFPYLFFIHATDSMDKATYIPLSFTEWLERLVDCQGREFWAW